MPNAIDAHTKRKILLLPFLFFAVTLVLAAGLAGLNALTGSSLNLLPGESLRAPAFVLILLYAISLNRQLKRAGLEHAVHSKPRLALLTLSTLVAAPVLGLLLAPALNGLMSLGGESTSIASVVGVESTHVKRSNRLHYYARIEAGAGLPAGRYFLGRYDWAWAPEYANSPLNEIKQIGIRYRTGMLGARTLLEAVPSTSER